MLSVVPSLDKIHLIYWMSLIYIYIYIYGEKFLNKVIQSDKFIVKESRRSSVSVLINNHQDFKKWWYQVLIYQWWMFNKIQKTRVEILYTNKEYTTFQSLNQRSKSIAWLCIYIYIYIVPLAPLQVSSYLNWDLGGRWTDVCKQ